MSTVSRNSRGSRANGASERFRDESGEARHKRSDTLVGTLRREYGAEFAKGFRGDSKLATVLRETESESLSDYLRRRPVPGRSATARDTARALGVSDARANRLIKTVDDILDERCRTEDGEIRKKRSDAVESGVKKKVGSTHAKTKTAKTRTASAEVQR